MAERIAIEALKPGMVIIQITAQNGPVRIRKSGLVTSDAMVTGLREMGVLELEIDPDQTVEIHAEKASQSQTRFLLQSNTSTQSSASTEQDSQLAEQFTRSLFLPTAQEIPDTWQIYSKKVAIGLTVIALGFGLGFGTSILIKGKPLAIVQQDTIQEQEVVEPETLPEQQAEQGAEQAATAVVEAEPGQADNNSADSPSQDLVASAETVNSQASESEVENSQESEMLVLGMQPSQQIDTTTGEVISNNLAQDGDVSQELLEKFQEVMADMEAQDSGLDNVPEPDVAPAPVDVPRVDQMPGWILSSLPKMSFSAHMYASEPADRWVKVNGKEIGEGDWVDGQLRIERIEPQHVILNFQGHEFSMRALSEW